MDSESCKLLDKLEKVVEELANPFKWNWTKMLSYRDAANLVLNLLAKYKVIEHKKHKYGGDIWIINDKKFGRVDD